MIEPFSINIAPAILDDLAERLARTRWTDDFANDDWRARERMMNAFPQFRTELAGMPDAICNYLECQPGDILEHLPDKTRKSARRRTA